MTTTIPNILGQPTWEIQDSSDEVSEFVVTTNTTLNKPEVSFSVNFTNTKPVYISVINSPYGVGDTDAELKALFDPTIINNTGVNWSGFRIDLNDPESGTGGGLHPMWAHFHDASNSTILSGWPDPNTGVFPYSENEGYDEITHLTHTPVTGLSSLNGASELQLSGGIFAAGTSESWSDIGIHEMRMNSHFDIELTPIAVDDFSADTTTTGTAPVGGSAKGALEVPGDHDWFKVQLTAGVPYTIDLKGDPAGSGGLLLDPSMELFDSSSQLIASNNDAGNSLNSEIKYTPTTSGTYYIDAGSPMFEDFTGSYRVSVSDLAHDSDFNGDGYSDILLQNTNSVMEAGIREMDGITPIPGGSQTVDGGVFGPRLTEIGTGDFDGDGHADILWQATNGTASIWEMNGTQRIHEKALNPNSGPSWHAIGTGDFNGDGYSDILWQNDNGQSAVWEMNGTTPIGGGPVANPAGVVVNPGPSWKAIGTGDFNGDGFSDILLQNTSGQVSIWEMNGNTITGGQVKIPRGLSSILGRVGKPSGREISTATAFRTFFFKTRTATSRSGR